MFARRILAALTLTVSLTGVGLALSPAAPAAAYDYNFGAIAYDNYGGTAAAWNYPTAQEAADVVEAQCGEDCGYFTFYNS